MFLDELINYFHGSIFRYEKAINYLKSRKIFEDDIKLYKLGYNKIIAVPQEDSPDRTRFLQESFKGRVYENRLIFPIMDASGRAIGITGRTIDKKGFKNFVLDEAKFTGYFFGLDLALPYIYSENKVYVVEGYTDVIAMRKVFPNTVATITSGISETQYNYLRLYCDNIITMFDYDKAGFHGTDKAEKMFPNIKRASLGNYEDPAKCYEHLSLKDFKTFVSSKVLTLG